MSITIAGVTFEDHEYDDRGDVLYLNVGEPQAAARTLETAEGHAVHYDGNWTVIGLTLLNVRWTLEHEGALTLTWPPTRVGEEQLNGALVA